MREKKQMVLGFVLLIVVAAVPGTAVAATEEGQAEGPKQIVLECRPGTVTEKVDWRSVEFSHPNCFCDDDPARLRNWVEGLADGWRSGEPLPQPREAKGIVGALAPGEQLPITLHCLSPEQIAEYRRAILAEREDTPGEE